MDPSAQGLLREERDYKRRANDDTADDSDSDIDATDYLDTKATPGTGKGKRALFTARPPTFRRLYSSKPSRCCCVSVVVIIGVVWIILGAGGYLGYNVYFQVPPYGQSDPWYPTPRGGIAPSWADSYKKASAMVAKMTLPEKVNITTGTGWMMGLAVGNTAPALNVGFPQLALQDGPLGLRFADNASAFPAGITVGATWNKDLMYARGKAHGQEARGKGINVLLGPCVGPLGRIPAGGRNWEGFGADPYLQGVAGAKTVEGIQSEHVMATIKHFVGNEQEHYRQPWEWGLPNAISSNIDDRTLHELYAWPFADAIRSGVASVMCSYNQVNNSYACSNSKLMNGILKDEMGFQGFVMSDWLAQRAGVASALSGLDMSMPGDGLRWMDGNSVWGPELTRSLLNGSVPVNRLNDMVTRIVAAWYQLGQDDTSLFDREPPNFSSWTDDATGVLSPGSPTGQDTIPINKYIDVQSNHSIIARQVAAEGIVMLKNDDLLPISPMGFTDARRKVSKRHNGKLKIGIYGEDAGPGDGPNVCPDRSCNEGTLGSGWGSGAVNFPYLRTPVDALTKGFNNSKATVSTFLTNSPNFKSDPATMDQDVCIVFANADSGEGYLAWQNVKGDRPDLYLQKSGDDLIIDVANGCGNGHGEVLVVIHSVGPVIMENWINLPTVKAVLLANLPGEESGNALADVIFGTLNPSGHLPYTIGKSLADYGPGAEIMTVPNGAVPQQNFSEGLYIDYRHFDKSNITPRFEFGFGLSYTTFEFSNLTVTQVKPKSALPSPRSSIITAVVPPNYDEKIPDEKEALWPSDIRRLEKYIYPYLDDTDDIVNEPYLYPDGYTIARPLSEAGGDEGGNPDLWETYVFVNVNVTNAGAKAGQVVAQLYLSYPEQAGAESSGLDFPVKVLRGFEKLNLTQKETQMVQFNVTRRDLSYWDVVRQNWVMLMDGNYTLSVGQSSRDLPLSGTW